MSRRSAARHNSAASPTGSAAAVSSSRRVSVGSGSSLRRKLCSIRLGRGVTSGSPNPPASSAGVNPRGTSSRASGLPRDSATSRSRTRSSRRPGSAAASSARASSSPSPPTINSGRPLNSRASLGSRTANTKPTASAKRRRATNARAWADVSSSHWASSTTQTSGCFSAASESRPSRARPTTKRSGGGLTARPNAVSSASRCGAGRRSRRSSIDAHS